MMFEINNKEARTVKIAPMYQEFDEEDARYIKELEQEIKYYEKRCLVRRMNGEAKMAETIEKIIESIKKVKQEIIDARESRNKP